MTREPLEREPCDEGERTPKTIRSQWYEALIAALVAVMLSLFGYAIVGAGLGPEVFLLVPFCTGITISYMTRPRLWAWAVGGAAVLTSMQVLLMTGREGLGCVAMAFPIIFVALMLGAFLGRIGASRLGHRNSRSNLLVVAMCVGALSLAGWASPGQRDPVELAVTTSIDIHAPIERVWKVVREPEALSGNDLVLRVLGLPVPRSCSIEESSERICNFDEGEIRQRVAESIEGKRLAVEIIETFEIRDWLTLKDAVYTFEQRAGFVRVTRRDRIESRLRPRWYWPWFESRCIRLEHDFVLGAMKRQAELGP